MIFVDTSALFALLDRDDANHARAEAIWTHILDSDAELFTTNYVVIECFALARRRLGFEAVRLLLGDLLPLVDVRSVDGELHRLAVASLLTAGRRRLSLVDCASFAAMRAAGSRKAFAFDRHFAEEGFGPP